MDTFYSSDQHGVSISFCGFCFDTVLLYECISGEIFGRPATSESSSHVFLGNRSHGLEYEQTSTIMALLLRK